MPRCQFSSETHQQFPPIAIKPHIRKPPVHYRMLIFQSKKNGHVLAYLLQLFATVEDHRMGNVPDIQNQKVGTVAFREPYMQKKARGCTANLPVCPECTKHGPFHRCKPFLPPCQLDEV
jgi:hypothetical protein